MKRNEKKICLEKETKGVSKLGVCVCVVFTVIIRLLFQMLMNETKDSSIHGTIT